MRVVIKGRSAVGEILINSKIGYIDHITRKKNKRYTVKLRRLVLQNWPIKIKSPDVLEEISNKNPLIMALYCTKTDNFRLK
jgi:hypothetical protein